MGLPTKASTDEIWQLIEGKLSEDGREPWNVQVIVQEPTQVGEGDRAQACLCLVDEGGVFMEMRIAAGSKARAEPEEEENSSEAALTDTQEDAPAPLWQELIEALEQLEDLKKKQEEAEEALAAKD